MAAVSIRASSIWGQYRTALLFLSTKNEISTQPLLEAALEGGKAVFAPRAESDRLKFYRISNPLGPWGEGAFGIREPLPAETLEKKDFPALIFTPGLAFDRQGNRLGRGGGFYDRFFSGLDAARLKYMAVGLCLESQIIDSVPVDEWDRPVHCLATESGFYQVETPETA
jgi:5-formyltetrahydrofolate cyclo-ligase